MGATSVRVTNIAAIVTGEGDLIVAGTPGTLISWHGPETVNVKWDAYMYVGDATGTEKANTAAGLLWETHYSNLKFKG